jgi:hypothetical protein
MVHEECAELAEPSVGAFDDQAAFLFSKLLVAQALAILAAHGDEVDGSLFEPRSQRV